MSKKNKIIVLPHNSLRKISKRVPKNQEDKTLAVVNEMKLATLDWEQSRNHEVGVALAAVQINKLQRIIIIREDFNDKANTNFRVFINPEIIESSRETIEDFEGCLSIKDVYGKIARHAWVVVRATDEHGKSLELKAEGFLARVFQHEIDHTDGVLFVDRIKNRPERFYKINNEGKIVRLSAKERKDNNSILW